MDYISSALGLSADTELEESYYDVLKKEGKFDNFEIFLKSIEEYLQPEEVKHLNLFVQTLKSNQVAFEFIITYGLLPCYVEDPESPNSLVFDSEKAYELKKERTDAALANAEITEEEYDELLKRSLPDEQREKLTQYMTLFCESYCRAYGLQ